jgi:hypothetical protein
MKLLPVSRSNENRSRQLQLSVFVSFSRTRNPVHTSIQEHSPLTRGRTTLNEIWTLSSGYKAIMSLVTCICFACFCDKSEEGRRSQRSMVLTRTNKTRRDSVLVTSCAWVCCVALSSTSAVRFCGFLYDSLSIYTRELSKSVAPCPPSASLAVRVKCSSVAGPSQVLRWQQEPK